MNVPRTARAWFPVFALAGVVLLAHDVAVRNGYPVFLELGLVLVYGTIAYIVLAAIDALFLP